MNSIDGGSNAGGANEDVEADESTKAADERHSHERAADDLVDNAGGTLSERDDADADDLLASPAARRQQTDEVDDLPDAGFRTPPNASLAGSSSIPDDTPSIPGSLVLLPVRGRSSPRGPPSRNPSGALQPFERRFSSRFSPSPSSAPRAGSPGLGSHSRQSSLTSLNVFPRAGSPAFLGSHSRQSSLNSQLLLQGSQNGDQVEQQAPWEVVRWTRLKKITGQAFSEIGKRNFGAPTCLAVSASIVIGTSKGLLLVFDYHQTLKSIIGQGTRATESGPISSIAISADYSTIAGGHSTGNILTWELAHPAKPFLHISPITPYEQQTYESDGHIAGRAILHIGFLGTRHTALVSADDGGMAFSHLATRGLGALARSVKTTRLLGRYPAAAPQAEANRKPSSVLAFSPLPLGNVEQATDNMGITALLTPYLLVIVSTTPIAQTQHKAARPKDVAPHGALSGCLAWFPAVRLKGANSDKEASETKLVYAWSDVLTVLSVDVKPHENPANEGKPPNLAFRPRDRWKCEEAIVAVQWLSRSVIGALTISQRLVILEDRSAGLHVMDSVDLIQRHIYHVDVFSQQLHTVVEQDEQESSMHGVVADAFFMSFRVHKGRVFLMGNADVSVGTLSNWADRLSALVEQGDDLGAIRLAVSYYSGNVGKVSVGLPEDENNRHTMVREKLLELINASLQYTFSGKDPSNERLRELAVECFDACLTIEELDYLFDDVYTYFQDAGQEAVFLEILESCILEEEVTSLPPPLVKDLVDRSIEGSQGHRLEELLCRLDPRTFDIDQITTLCKQHFLYDALIHVWNEALKDYITPLVELLTLIVHAGPGPDQSSPEDAVSDTMGKVYPYLAYLLTNRLYPKGEPIDEEEADGVQADMYKYLFSDQVMAWPPGSRSILKTQPTDVEEPDFPYLRLLLQYDAASFMSMLNEAFEDPFLNTVQEQGQDYFQSHGTLNGGNVKITRQQIVSVLLEIMSGSEFSTEQTIYLDMFIARSLPKYSQFMILSGSSLQQVLGRLCSFDDEDSADDRQLSAEYLLSVYHPAVTPGLVGMLRDARFYRVLKSVYRGDHQYANLISTYFEDPHDKASIFDDLARCLRPETPNKQLTDVHDLLYKHANELAFVDTPRTAQTLSRYSPNVLEGFVTALDESRSRFIFLRTLLEPSLGEQTRDRSLQSQPPESLVAKFCEQYVQLMCIHDPSHVADYIGLLKSGDLRLDQVLPAMEENGAIDAAVTLLARDGLARDAMERLVKHMHALRSALCSLIRAATDSPDATSAEEAATDLTEAIDKYSRIGVWLCQGQSAATEGNRRPRHRTNAAWDVKEDDLDLDEYLWLTLVDVVVAVAKDVSVESEELPEEDSSFDGEKITNHLRAIVQQVFTALLAATSSPANPTAAAAAATAATTDAPQQRPRPPTSQSFLRVFRAFLTRASLSAPSLSDLRAVLLDIFSAYAYEADVLNLATQLLGRDVFADIAGVHARRQRGWRPKTLVCEHCKRRAWGPGTGEAVWDDWCRRETERAEGRTRARADAGCEAVAARGKGKASEVVAADGTGWPGASSQEAKEQVARMALVVFACRHVFHRACLDERATRGAAKVVAGRYKCPLCDGE